MAAATKSSENKCHRDAPNSGPENSKPRGVFKKVFANHQHIESPSRTSRLRISFHCELRGSIHSSSERWTRLLYIILFSSSRHINMLGSQTNWLAAQPSSQRIYSHSAVCEHTGKINGARQRFFGCPPILLLDKRYIFRPQGLINHSE